MINVENRYERAIKDGKSVEFLLARDDYFFESNFEVHSPIIIAKVFFDYSYKYGNDKMLSQLNKDIEKSLGLNLTLQELFYITHYIYIYNRYYFDNLDPDYENKASENNITLEWKISGAIKRLFYGHYKKMIQSYGSINKCSFEVGSREPNDGFIFHQLKSNIDIIQNRFGIILIPSNLTF
ncbi:MAG: hypothetical protein KAG64_01890 [Bacteroidales bacterium]|nr:hypothetical protein [Bacteroidales bacterium]